MVIIKNRQMLFSNRENYLGTAYDNNSKHLEFALDRINDDGTDMAGLIFNMNLSYSDDATTDTLVPEMTTEAERAVLTFTLPDTVMTHKGTHYVQLVGYDESGSFKWSTFKNVVYIEDAFASTPSEATLSALEELIAKFENQVKKDDAKEEARATAETARAAAETARVEAEDARVIAETGRVEAEEARVTAEAARVTEIEALVTGYDAASLLAKSYAVGGTGTRAGEDTDNAKYYKEQAQAVKVGALHESDEGILYFGDSASTSSTAGEDITGVVTQDTDTKEFKVSRFKDETARTDVITLMGDESTSGSVKQLVKAETDRATAAEGTLTSNLNAEILRAQGAEQTNAGNIAAEISRAETKESELSRLISANGTAINTEQSRAQDAENTLTTNLASEVKRATAAEEGNAASIEAVQTSLNNLWTVVHTW